MNEAGHEAQVLLVRDGRTSIDTLAALSKTIESLGLSVRTISVARGSAVGAMKWLQALVGEDDLSQLEEALDTTRPDVVVACAPAVAASLVEIRDRRLQQHGATEDGATPVVVVVPDFSPGRPWVVNADRYAVIDDEAAVTLAEQGADGARVIVTGLPVSHTRHTAKTASKEQCRKDAGVALGLPVVLVDARAMGNEVLHNVVVQLTLFGDRIFVLFDAGERAETASWLRKQVPMMGLRAKMFGAAQDSSALWRAADVVIAPARAESMHAATAAGCALVVLEPRGANEVSEARAAVERGFAQIADRALLLAAVIDGYIVNENTRRSAIAAAESRAASNGLMLLTDLIVGVGADRAEVLQETLEVARETERSVHAERQDREQAARRAAGPAKGLEDLGGGGDRSVPAGPDRSSVERLTKEILAAEARANRELGRAREEMVRWEQRGDLASARGDDRLVVEAKREADRKRARMHEALKELARLATEKQRLAESRTGRVPDAAVDDALRDLKSNADSQVRSIEEELAELKRRMKDE